MPSKHVVHMGAVLSDLIADVYALAIEDEHDDSHYQFLAHRILCIKAATASIVKHAEAIAAERREEQ